MVAYSSVCHIGLVCRRVFTRVELGWAGGVCLGLAHGLCSPTVFMILGFVTHKIGRRCILLCKGALVSIPVLSLCWFVINCFNLGTPPSSGFFGEVISYCRVVG